MITFLSIVFWGVSTLLFYTYFGYPILLWVLTRFVKHRSAAEPSCCELPTTTLLITAHNEAKILPAKLDNLLLTEFPGQLEILFVLDGTTDESRSLIESAQSRFANCTVRIFATDQRVGKEEALRLAMKTVTSQAIVFSDADSMYEPDTIHKLVQAIMRPGVGAACGHEKQIPKNSQGAGEGNGLFYRYENKVKELLTRVCSLTYIQGGVFAMWRADYPESIPRGLTQDGVLVFSLMLKNKEIVFVDEARSTEVYVLSTEQDFRRRIRTITRAFASVIHFWRVFLPWKTGFFGFHLLSHRVLRWWTLPLMMIVLAINTALAWFDWRYSLPLGVQVAFWVFSFVGWILESRGVRVKLFYVPFYFVYIHLAASIAVCNVLLGRRISVWTPSQRPSAEVSESLQPKTNAL